MPSRCRSVGGPYAGGGPPLTDAIAIGVVPGQQAPKEAVRIAAAAVWHYRLPALEDALWNNMLATQPSSSLDPPVTAIVGAAIFFLLHWLLRRSWWISHRNNSVVTDDSYAQGRFCGPSWFLSGSTCTMGQANPLPTLILMGCLGQKLG
jgi:hypothetical protein